jgi:hypothetical protein
LAVHYPLWVGGEEVSALARRLGNHLGVLPFTTIVDADGTVLARKVGPYSEAMLGAVLAETVAKDR